MQPKVSIVILNWNGLEDTSECIRSVMNLEYDNREVILVDNGSVDGSVKTLQGLFPSITVMENKENNGFARANNQAIEYALARGTEYVWLLNNDTITVPDALSKLVFAAESPEIGLASPIIYFHEPGGKIQFCGSIIDWENKRIRHIEGLEELASVESGENLSLWGTALLMKRRTLSDVGYLSEKYFAYHEDEEYCMRVARAGYRCVVVPEARIFHKNSRSTGSNDAPMQVFLRSRNLFFLWMDALRGMDRIQYVPKYLAHIVSYGGSLKGKNLTESVEACLDGVWSAFRGVGGPRNPEITMPLPLRILFRFLFSWHPYFWASLLRADFVRIRADMAKRAGADRTTI
jgi:GT2 family glycosyltransferase